MQDTRRVHREPLKLLQSTRMSNDSPGHDPACVAQVRSGIQLCTHDFTQLNVSVLVMALCKNVNMRQQSMYSYTLKVQSAFGLPCSSGVELCSAPRCLLLLLMSCPHMFFNFATSPSKFPSSPVSGLTEGYLQAK